ncbi:MAG: hypothetical protein IKH26_02120 [Bacteroidaceae bacterium]|nr:hypothetical protein [Bacteroidaceae bacterium]
MKKTTIIYRLLPTLAFIAFCLFVLLGLRKEYLEEVAGMTPFYLSPTFTTQTWGQGFMGGITWCSTALCACMTNPVLGASLLTLLLTLLSLLIRYVLRVKWQWLPLCFIPSLWLLGNFTSRGYELYTSKDSGTEFNMLFIAITITAIMAPLSAWWTNRTKKTSKNSATSQTNISKKTTPNSKTPVIYFVVSLLGMTLMAWHTYHRTFKDENYRNILRMKQAVDKNDWQQVLDIARQQSPDLPPTRIQVCYTRLALYKLGLSGESTFSYPDGDADYATPNVNQYLRLIAGPQLYYFLGKPNYAYRWCMEDMVEYGLRPQYLSYMLRSSLLNEEKTLAEKYARQLNAHPFYHIDYEHDYEAEVKAIQPLLEYNNILDGDGGHVEAYLLQNYATMRGGTREMVTLSLDCALILKDINDFWPLFIKMLPVWEHENGNKIPRHYQEAALLFANLQGNIDLSQVNIEDNIKEQFNNLIAEANANSQYGDEYNATRLRPLYGNTYWYYFFFTTGLKTN